jgi:hypothetical protein
MTGSSVMLKPLVRMMRHPEGPVKVATVQVTVVVELATVAEAMETAAIAVAILTAVMEISTAVMAILAAIVTAAIAPAAMAAVAGKVKVKNCVYINTIFLYRRLKVSKVGKESDFSYFITFCCGIFQSQCMAIQPYSM